MRSTLIALLILPAFLSNAQTQESADSLCRKGASETAAGRPMDAVSTLTNAIRLYPRHAWAYYERGKAYIDLRDSVHCFQDLSTAIKLEPADTIFIVARGLAYTLWHDRPNALKDYSHALALNPNYAPAYYDRGIMNFYAGDYQAAVEDYTHALESLPAWAEAYFARAKAYLFLEYYDKAIADYSRALQLKPNLPLAVLERGVAYRLGGRYLEALIDYTRAIELMPDSMGCYYGRGQTRILLKDYRGALADFEKAAELMPGSDDARKARQAAYRLMQEEEQTTFKADLPTICGLLIAAASIFLFVSLVRGRQSLPAAEFLMRWRQAAGTPGLALLFFVPFVLVGMMLIPPIRFWALGLTFWWKMWLFIALVAYLQFLRVKKMLTRADLPPGLKMPGTTIFLSMMVYLGILGYLLLG